MKHLLMAVAAATALGLTFAQEAATPITTEPVKTTVATTQIEEKSVQDMIDEFLASRGWQGGRNLTKNGEIFHIASATAPLKAPINSHQYISDRMNAFNQAMLNAQAIMLESLAKDIESSTLHSYQEGEFPSEEAIKEAQNTTSIMGKVQALIRAKLDAALREEGVDPYAADTAKAQEAAKKLLLSSAFSKTIKSGAQAYLNGVRVVQTFEGTETGKKGQIGVIVMWSQKSQQMSEAIITGIPVHTANANKKIIEQIPRDPKQLLGRFGVEQMIDEEGDLVLVSFAQAGGKSESAYAEQGARARAKEHADALLREFAGQQFTRATDTLEASTIEEFENDVEEYNDTSAFAQKTTATAEKLRMSGIHIVRNWKTKHPLNGRTVYGCICAWSPKQASLAKELKARIAETPRTPNEVPLSETPKANSPKTNSTPAPKAKDAPKGTTKSFYSEGYNFDENTI